MASKNEILEEIEQLTGRSIPFITLLFNVHSLDYCLDFPLVPCLWETFFSFFSKENNSLQLQSLSLRLVLFLYLLLQNLTRCTIPLCIIPFYIFPPSTLPWSDSPQSPGHNSYSITLTTHPCTPPPSFSSRVVNFDEVIIVSFWAPQGVKSDILFLSSTTYIRR